MTGSGDEHLEAGDQWRTVSLAVAAAQRRIDRALEDAGIPAAWFPVVSGLVAAPDRRLAMSTIARDLAMTPGGFTKLADRMARDGLIDRRGSDSDRRIVHARLTDEGATLAARAAEVYGAAVETEILATLTPAALARAASSLAKLSAAGAPVDAAAPEAASTPTARRRTTDR